MALHEFDGEISTCHEYTVLHDQKQTSQYEKCTILYKSEIAKNNKLSNKWLCIFSINEMHLLS
jgi:hypothetical protein